jgi:hypothetical protein
MLIWPSPCTEYEPLGKRQRIIVAERFGRATGDEGADRLAFPEGFFG